MTKQEFLDRVTVKSVPDKEWGVIEFVYTWHPLISETKGKDQVAYLYDNFGIGIFNEMLSKAEKAHKLDIELCQAMNKVDEVKGMISRLKDE
jgi:hypothetical protein